MDALITEVKRLNIRSIAVPPMGCGNGELDRREVKPRIERAFQAVPEVRMLLFTLAEGDLKSGWPGGNLPT